MSAAPRPSLLATAAVLCALALACYPAAQCDYTTAPNHAPVSFEGTDCVGFGRLVDATTRAFGTCDAGSPEDARAALSGWRVSVLPTNKTVARDDAGDRYWRPTLTEAAQLCVENPPCDPSDAGSVAWVQAHGQLYGETFPDHHIDLADEHWRSGTAATELVHAATGEYVGGNPYTTWRENGRACVVTTVQHTP